MSISHARDPAMRSAAADCALTCRETGIRGTPGARQASRTVKPVLNNSGKKIPPDRLATNQIWRAMVAKTRREDTAAIAAGRQVGIDALGSASA
jgi:hypothetical protein